MTIRKTFGARVGAAVVAAGLVTVLAPTAALADGGDSKGDVARPAAADRPIMDENKDSKYDYFKDCIKAAREAKEAAAEKKVHVRKDAAADKKGHDDMAAAENGYGDKAAADKKGHDDMAAAGKDGRRYFEKRGPNAGDGSTASDKADCKYVAKPGPGTGDGSTAAGGAGSATAVGGALLGLGLTAGIVVLRRRNNGAAAA
ncbi:hypothetical protein [Actinopolymorpha pittospori]